MKTVMCFGTFDILHLGHLHYFEQAKKYGDYLIVVIARDATKKQQNKKIIFSEKERFKLIQSLKVADKVVLGDSKNHFQIILKHRPAVICLGYDHRIKEAQLQQELFQLGLTPKIVRITSYQTKKHKSTKIKKKLLQA